MKKFFDMNIIKNNLANLMTVSRLFLLPVMVWLLYIPHSWAAWLCLFLYIIAATTDYFDGYTARKLNQISDFGTFLDPISDKIFVSTLLIMLVANDTINGGWIILVILIFAREFLVSGLREYLGGKSIKVPVSFLAKIKTTAQMLSLGFLIMAGHAPYTLELGQIFLLLATILTLLTGISYMRAGFKHFKNVES